MPSSFHNTQLVELRDRIIALFRPGANRREIAVRQIGVGALGGVRFPEDPELASMHGAGQTRGEETVIVIGIDPDRALRGIVAMVRRGAPYGGHSAEPARRMARANNMMQT